MYPWSWSRPVLQSRPDPAPGGKTAIPSAGCPPEFSAFSARVPRRRNRPGSEMIYKRFLPAVAGALLLLANVSGSMGGCIDDPCKFPSLGLSLRIEP